MMPWVIREKWDKLRWWLNPRQKWLTKKIPNHWIDKDYLWELVILEGIKHYVEGERVFEVLSNDNPPEQAQFLKEVRQRYNEITMALPSLEKQMEDAWKKVPKWDIKDINTRKVDYDATYGDLDRLEKKIFDLKTEIMEWAVKNREKIWT